MIRNACIALLLAAGQATAQYIEPESEGLVSDRWIAAGLAVHHVRPLSSNGAPDSVRSRFRSLTPVVRLHVASVDLAFAYTRFDQGANTRTAISLSAVSRMEIPFSRGASTGFMVPVLFGGDFMKIEGAGPVREEFNIATLAIGTGLAFRGRSRTSRLDLSVGAAAGYSFRTYDTESGFSAAILADARVAFRSAIFEGLVLGTSLRYQTWSMASDQFNHGSLMYGVYLGVMF